MNNCQLAIFYSPTGEVVRLISYSSPGHALKCAGRAMKWLNPDRFHWSILEGGQMLPIEFVGIPAVSGGSDALASCKHPDCLCKGRHHCLSFPDSASRYQEQI